MESATQSIASISEQCGGPPGARPLLYASKMSAQPLSVLFFTYDMPLFRLAKYAAALLITVCTAGGTLAPFCLFKTAAMYWLARMRYEFPPDGGFVKACCQVRPLLPLPLIPLLMNGL